MLKGVLLTTFSIISFSNINTQITREVLSDRIIFIETYDIPFTPAYTCIKLNTGEFISYKEGLSPSTIIPLENPKQEYERLERLWQARHNEIEN